MSAAHRCRTCCACGHEFKENEVVSVEPLLEIDSPARYVAVCWRHSTFPPAKAGSVKAG